MTLPHLIAANPTGQTTRPPSLTSAHVLAERSPTAPQIRSIYIHIPFCSHKCHYCDFYSIVDSRDRQGEFTDRLIGELSALAPLSAGAAIETVFIGGGTPSLLAIPNWQRLLDALHRLFDLSNFVQSGVGSPAESQADAGAHHCEWTVECNPESTTKELCELLASRGVNRVSVGAQSFNPAHLKTLERWHDPANVARAIENASSAGIRRQSVDLIFEIPGQTLDDWASDLDRALALNTTHVSCYDLTYEPNTAMTVRMRLGRFDPTPEELCARMYELAVEKLASRGLRRYEVSNFAAAGNESLHNLAYWRGTQWLAAGPSASGHAWISDDPAAGSLRWKNTPRLGDYLQTTGCAPISEHESLGPVIALRERVLMGLRLAGGIDARQLLDDAQRHSVSTVRIADAINELTSHAWLDTDQLPGRWSLTDHGFLMADAAIAELMAAIGDDEDQDKDNND